MPSNDKPKKRKIQFMPKSKRIRITNPGQRIQPTDPGQRARIDCGLVTAWHTATEHEFVALARQEEPPEIDTRANVRVQQLAPGLFKALHRHEDTWCGPIDLRAPSLEEALRFAHLAWLDTMAD